MGIQGERLRLLAFFVSKMGERMIGVNYHESGLNGGAGFATQSIGVQVPRKDTNDFQSLLNENVQISMELETRISALQRYLFGSDYSQASQYDVSNNKGDIPCVYDQIELTNRYSRRAMSIVDLLLEKMQ